MSFIAKITTYDKNIMKEKEAYAWKLHSSEQVLGYLLKREILKL